ncbi:MAG: lipid-transfer protein [Myxococcota bacterium]|nr:lipid-transfer protein [Myxococcota bacterium]
MNESIYVVGVGMTRFEKPGARDWDYPDMVREAGAQALQDSSLDYTDVQQAYAGYCYGDSTSGQRAVYELGLTGIPVFNVNNNCATGASALFLARQAVLSGTIDCALAVGFEKMEKGSLGFKYPDRTFPMDRHVELAMELRAPEQSPLAAQWFGNAGREHAERFGTTAEQFAMVAEKNHRHSSANPRAQFRDVYTLEEVLQAREVHAPLTKLQCCPTSDGAAAALVCSARFVRERGLEDRAVEIAAMAMATDRPDSFDDRSFISLVGAHMTTAAARQCYQDSGLGPEDVQVVELHDCFSTNEILSYEALDLCPEGRGGEWVASGATTYGGQCVVNPSGGLISKGHPLGATGLAQCAELVWQLRGQADDRQVTGARVGLQHNLGLGGAAVVALYRAPAS